MPQEMVRIVSDGYAHNTRVMVGDQEIRATRVEITIEPHARAMATITMPVELDISVLPKDARFRDVITKPTRFLVGEPGPEDIQLIEVEGIFKKRANK